VNKQGITFSYRKITVNIPEFAGEIRRKDPGKMAGAVNQNRCMNDEKSSTDIPVNRQEVQEGYHEKSPTMERPISISAI
jgi:hypothetical protein